MFQKRVILVLLAFSSIALAAKPVQKGMIELVAASCCDPIIKKVQFHEKFNDIPQILLTIRAIEYDIGPIGFFAQVSDVTLTDFHFQLSVTHSSIKQLNYEYVAINQDEVEFGFFNSDALSSIKVEESGDRIIPTFMKFRRTFADDPVVQVFLIGLESTSKLIQFEVAPLSVSNKGVTLNLKKFGETSVQKIQLAYVATQSSKELAQQVTHTGQKSANIDPPPAKEEEKKEGEEEKDKDKEKEKKGEFLQLRQGKPKLVQVNGLNGLRFMQGPVGFMWQGDSIEPTALNVNLRITLDKGNQAVLGLYYFEEKAFRKCPVVYTMCNFQGSMVYLCKDVPNFNSILKVAKSIFIPEKTSVMVYQENSYGGAKTKITKSIECISDWFTDVPETEQKDIKKFLQINQMKRHKDQEFLEIRQGGGENQRVPELRLPNWVEEERAAVIQEEAYGGPAALIERDTSPSLNSIKQELSKRVAYCSFKILGTGVKLFEESFLNDHNVFDLDILNTGEVMSCNSSRIHLTLTRSLRPKAS